MTSDSTPNITESSATTTHPYSYELMFGITITLFAAILALNELGGGKYGDDEIKLTNERTSSYLWYQSKGIKGTLAEGQRETMKILLAAGGLQAEQAAGFQKQILELDRRVIRYDQEQEEIMKGSGSISADRWSLDVNGQKGKVVGVKEMEKQLDNLAAAGDRFDLGALFLQLSLVVGAIGILLQQPRLKRVFYLCLVGMGVVGSGFAVLGYLRAGFF